MYEQREMARVRHVALQAAAKSLRDPLGVRGVVQDVNADEPGVPVLALPEPASPIETPSDPVANERKSGESGRSGKSDIGQQAEDAGGTTLGELPVMFRRSSEEPGSSGQAGSRPTLPRQTPVASYKSAEPTMKRSSSDLAVVRDAQSQTDTPKTEEQTTSTGRSTPILFPLDVDDEQTVRGHAAESTQNGLGIDMGDERAGFKGHGDVPEDWMKTRAARRVSLAAIPDINRLQAIDTKGTNGVQGSNES